MFIYWDCKILSGTATFHKRGVLDCNFQNPSEIPDHMCMTVVNTKLLIHKNRIKSIGTAAVTQAVTC